MAKIKGAVKLAAQQTYAFFKGTFLIAVSVSIALTIYYGLSKAYLAISWIQVFVGLIDIAEALWRFFDASIPFLCLLLLWKIQRAVSRAEKRISAAANKHADEKLTDCEEGGRYESR